MNKTAIKNFAIWARNKLIADISYRAGLMGITAEGIHAALPQSTGQTEFYDIGTAEPYAITGTAIRQRRHLAELIQRKEKDTDYKTAYKYIIEEVAYTWFNRLIAVRFMEVNDYLPSHIRVLSSESGKMEPDLVTMPFDADLEFTNAEQQIVLELKNANKLDEVFRLLFIKQCNALNDILPALFEKTNDYTELLLNLSVIDQDGVVYHLVHDIPEEDFDVERGGQIEIIGWLYQYYNTEPKNEAFAKKGKITKEEVPAVTQLFTPDWIVRYMVENSLGRLWVEGHPNDNLKAGWKYYLEEAEQEPEVQAQLTEIRAEYAKLNPEDIIIIDPCMGSGHILVYAFDVLMQIYESAGYGQRDAARSILDNNLYGLDIDDRAFQMAYFSVMMKARQYNRRILNGEDRPNLYSIQESNGINRNQLKYFGRGMNGDEIKTAVFQLNYLLGLFKDAKEYGSILTVEECDWELLERFVSTVEKIEQISFESVGIEEAAEKLSYIIKQGKCLSQKYTITVTNPPYMKQDNMSPSLENYIVEHYSIAKYDTYAAFALRCSELTKTIGAFSLVTMHNFMFTSSYRDFRDFVVGWGWENIIHLGTRAFAEINGEVVQTCAYSVRKGFCAKKMIVADLTELGSEEEKRRAFLSGDYHKYSFCLDNVEFIPNHVFGYALSDIVLELYKDNNILSNYGETKAGVVTGNDDYFIRQWQEVVFQDIELKPEVGRVYKYVHFSKGGAFDKWFGNDQSLLKLEDLWDDNKTNKSVRRGDPAYYFKKGIGWSQMGGGVNKAYSIIEYSVCKNTTPMFYVSDNTMFYYILGYLNSGLPPIILKAINPTLSIFTSDILALPFVYDKVNAEEICCLSKKAIIISSEIYKTKEEHWQFTGFPFGRNYKKIADTIICYREKIRGLNNELNIINLRLNSLFSSIMGFGASNSIRLEPPIDSNRMIVFRILQFYVGCIFGRYSLDVQGLVFAGGEWDAGKYSMFIPDENNVIPISDEEYFENDIVSRLCDWLKVVYGENTLEENLDFIAKALGNKGDSSRAIIRNYFLNDFFRDHCQTYSVAGSGKRPIYWLFDSGKQNGFKALIYLHRYNADTIGNLRIDYLHRIQRIYETEIGRMQDMIDHSFSAREAAQATKRREKLTKQLKECREYDEKLAHLALSRIELDLDDGVKVNYRKVQTANDGKFYEVLADSKSIMAKK